jgi:uncharacterized membrane protein YvbJ
MICKHCGTEIAEKALICYRCGNATTEPRIKPPSEGPIFERRRRSRLPLIVLVIMIVLALIAAWALGLFNSQLPTGSVHPTALENARRELGLPQPPTGWELERLVVLGVGS